MVKVKLNTPNGVIEATTDSLSGAAGELVNLLQDNGYAEREGAAYALGMAFGRVENELRMFRYASQMPQHKTAITVELPGLGTLKGEALFTRAAA